ncbi:tryptophan synthase beta subunit-like PLP-dependent enzyme [Pseudovirgaria hyperparasitica]|uniref:L-serine ammonia-lyase n=1 Tax=Pseudovirgaria hyperparasitica TaxID=470096 RepID=A0A6A6VQB9_9PEZI|nr:tryptophan synthase beta subunit-like PLP-dependent enzyme [Pseudovirgaria hyperparasitica]KAF2752812.1 tryptophan synthase beta subunit-like PLP-dependent enzyme [Pseudovirgaria hyperparasitica]
MSIDVIDSASARPAPHLNDRNIHHAAATSSSIKTAPHSRNEVMMNEYPRTWVKTPLKESAALSRAAGCRVFLKLENLQPSGSFKSRGVGNYMLCRLRERLTDSPNTPIHFYSSSGGNAGIACAYAAQSLGYPATIVVPTATKPAMISKMRTAGAHDVISHGASWQDADGYLRDEVLCKDPNGVYVPPFDHPDIWEGNKTTAYEIRDQLDEKPDVMICSVGGGGLFNGFIKAMHEMDWGDVPFLAMETIGADSLNKSVIEGKHITLPRITSRATCLGAIRIANKTWENMQANKNVQSIALPDAEAAMGCWRLADDERILVEMACGVCVVLCYDGRLQKIMSSIGKKLTPQSRVVITVCGGSDISVESLYEMRKEYAWVEKTVSDGTNGSGAPGSFTIPVVVGHEHQIDRATN